MTRRTHETLVQFRLMLLLDVESNYERKKRSKTLPLKMRFFDNLVHLDSFRFYYFFFPPSPLRVRLLAGSSFFIFMTVQFFPVFLSVLVYP